MNFISNKEIYDLARASSVTFKKITPESYDEFVHQIAGMNTEEARQLTNDFTSSLLMLYLNKVEGVKAKNPYEGLLERFFVPFKGIKENMYVRARKPINPKFKNKVDGESVDMQMYTKPSTEAIYYTFNDDYQNTISIPTDDMKTAIENENGLSMLISGYMQGLASEYTRWEREHTANVLSEMLNSSEHPLKDSQVVEVSLSENVTRDELKAYVATVNNIADAMEIEDTEAFNIGNFPKYVNKGELVLVTRPGIKNTLKTQLLESAFNKEELNMEVKHVVVPDFGGLIPKFNNNEVFPIYDKEGRPTGNYAATKGGKTKVADDTTVTWEDPNADVIGIIMEKGTLFIDEQNPYEVGAAPYNYAGRYVTYWANKPNVGFHYDMFKNVVVIKKAA